MLLFISGIIAGGVLYSLSKKIVLSYWLKRVEQRRLVQDRLNQFQWSPSSNRVPTQLQRQYLTMKDWSTFYELSGGREVVYPRRLESSNANPEGNQLPLETTDKVSDSSN